MVRCSGMESNELGREMGRPCNSPSSHPHVARSCGGAIGHWGFVPCAASVLVNEGRNFYLEEKKHILIIVFDLVTR